MGCFRAGTHRYRQAETFLVVLMSTDVIDLAAERKKRRPTRCLHGVKFDLVRAKNMTVEQVRVAFPRLHGPCPLGCGFVGVAYACKAHYVYGDW